MDMTSSLYFRCLCWNNDTSDYILKLWILTFVSVLSVNGYIIRQPTQSASLLQSRGITKNIKPIDKFGSIYEQQHGKRISFPQPRRALHVLYSTDDNSSENEKNATNVIYYNDFDDAASANTKVGRTDKSETSIWKQVQMRQQQLVKDRIQQSKKIITSGDCKSKVGLEITNDWIRRLSIHTYPYTIIGTSSDHVYLADIEMGKLWGTSEKSKVDSSWSQSILSQRLQYVTQQMFGMYDGGGTLAVAIYHTLLFEATRDGNVNVYRFNGKDLSNQSKFKSISDGGSGIEFTSLGSFQSLKDCLVTSLHCSNDKYVWIGTDTGRVEVYQLQNSNEQGEWTIASKQPYRTYQVGTGRTTIVLSIHVQPFIKCAVVTTNTGSIELLYYGTEPSNQNESKPIGSFTPTVRDSMKRRAVNVYPTCATIIEVPRNVASTINDDKATLNEATAPTFAIVCGTNDGGLYLQKLNTTTKTTVNGQEQKETGICIHQPLMNTSKSIQPFHFEWVKCITCMGEDGLLLTGAIDGTIRLWDIATSTTSNDGDNDENSKDGSIAIKMIYQLMGYKVWLGSIWTDGKRIISDGADNTVIVHDFTKALESVSSSPSSSTNSTRSFNDNYEDPFNTGDRPKKPPSPPRVDDDSADEYPLI